MTERFEVIVLGSGGPFAKPSRASPGYLLELDGTGSILVDAGGGVFGRLGKPWSAASGYSAWPARPDATSTPAPGGSRSCCSAT